MRTGAVRFTSPRKVELVEVDVPAPAPGEVLVRTLFSGISSGTEMLAYRGEIDPDSSLDESISSLSGSFRYPFAYGYSCVGVVMESRGALERGAMVFAFHPHQGAFVTGEQDVVTIDGIDARAATLFPHVETALQVSLDAGPVIHETVVVMGLGAVGLLSAALLAGSGARVVCAEPDGRRRDAAERFGLRCVEPVDLPARVLQETEGEGAALLVEATGNPSALSEGLDLLAQEGTALIVSWYGIKPVSLPLGGRFHRRRLTIRSTQVTTIPAPLRASWSIERRRHVAAGLLRELPVGVLATHTFPLDQAASAFAAVDRGAEGLIHAALSYEGE